MNQMPLLIETIYKALDDVVRAAGGSKEVGAMLYPEKTPDAAGRLVNHCCDPDRQEKFDPEQMCFLRRLGRKHNCHSIMHYEAGDAHYEYKPVDPETEKEKLQREFIESVKHQKSIIAQIEKMGINRASS